MAVADGLNVRISANIASFQRNLQKATSSLSKLQTSAAKSIGDIKSAFEKATEGITADIAELQRDFRQELQKTTSSLSKLQTSASKSSGGIKSAFSSAGNGVTASFNKISSAAKKVGAVIAAAFAVDKIVKFSKEAIEAASDLAEVQNVVDTVFGSMSDSVNSWAKGAMTQFGLGETAAKQYASTMGAMLKSSGITGDALETMSLNMASLAADMASFYNLSTDTAFEKIRSGISGETEPLKQLGINMSVANLEAYALAQGITKSYDAMTQAEQTMLRYNYLLSVTGDAQNDFSRTSDSWANQVRVLQQQWEKLKTTIGQGLIAALTPALQLLNKLLEKLNAFAQAFAQVFGGGDDTADSTSQSMNNTAESAEKTADNLKDADKSAKALKNTISGIDELNIISEDTDTSANTADDALTIKPNSVYNKTLEEANGITDEMLAKIAEWKEKLQPVADLAAAIKQSFQEAFSGGLGDEILQAWADGLNTVVDLIAAMAEGILKAWSKDNAGTEMIVAWGEAVRDVSLALNEMGQAMVTALGSESGDHFFDSMLDQAAAVGEMIDSIANSWREAFSEDNAGEQMFEQLLETAASVNDVITGIATSISEVFSSEIGTNLFSAIIESATNFMAIIDAIADSWNYAWTACGYGTEILSGIAGVLTNIVEFANVLGERFLEAWNNNELGNQVMTSIASAVSSIIGLVGELSSAWLAVWDTDVTTDMFTGLLNIIKNIADAVSNVGQNLTDAFSSTGADTQIFTAIQSAIAGIITVAEKASGVLKNAFSNVDWTPFVQSAAALATAISNVVQAAAGLAGGVIASFGAQLAAAFESSIPTIINAVSVALQAVANAINALSPQGVLALAEGITTLVVAFKAVNMISTVVGLFDKFSGAISTVEAKVVVLSTVLTALVVAVTALVNAWKDLTSATNSASSSLSTATTAASSSSLSSSSSVSAASYSAVSAASIPELASGGVVKSGQLFIANEQTGNPELVGSQNGQSVVMNNAQIVDAVSSGVASALQPLIDSMQGGETEQTLKIRGTDLLYIMTKAQRRKGATISNNFNFGGA